jgi:transposase
VSVSLPTPAQESARDLVRAREVARGDLMRARHRLSKLLLRQGIVYCGEKAWTNAHDGWETINDPRRPVSACRRPCGAHLASSRLAGRLELTSPANVQARAPEPAAKHSGVRELQRKDVDALML